MWPRKREWVVCDDRGSDDCLFLRSQLCSGWGRFYRTFHPIVSRASFLHQASEDEVKPCSLAGVVAQGSLKDRLSQALALPCGYKFRVAFPVIPSRVSIGPRGVGVAHVIEICTTLPGLGAGCRFSEPTPLLMIQHEPSFLIFAIA